MTACFNIQLSYQSTCNHNYNTDKLTSAIEADVINLLTSNPPPTRDDWEYDIHQSVLSTIITHTTPTITPYYIIRVGVWGWQSQSMLVGVTIITGKDAVQLKWQVQLDRPFGIGSLDDITWFDVSYPLE